MTKIEGKKEWSDVLLLEDGDVLHGGDDGLINVQAKALVDRTEYLKEELLEVKEQTAGLGPNMGGGSEGGGGNLPAGTIIAFGGTTAPVGFLECNGATLSRTTFAGLFAAIGTVWGEPSPTTFKIPNFTEAERFLRSRSEALPVGTLQGDATRNITGEIGIATRMGVSVATGAFKPYLAGTTYFGGVGTNQAPISALFDASLQVPTADENRPKSAVVMYCIKVSDSVIDPDQILASNVISEIANKASRSEVQALAGTRLWVSDEHQPILNTPTIITHGLNIDPLRCRCDVHLKCLSTEGGHSVGDLIPFWSALGASQESPVGPFLYNQTIQYNTGPFGNGLYAINKANGSYFGITLSKWRYIFRIWY